MTIKRKLLWLAGLGLIGLAAVTLILASNRLASQSSADAALRPEPPLVVLSPKKISQDPNQSELLQQIEQHGSAAGLDFSNRNLSDLDLSPAALANMQRLRPSEQLPAWLDAATGGGNLTGINLSGGVLINSDLNTARLVEANLQNAHLLQANLSRANLALANLAGANLTLANLEAANLAKADLTGADLSLANLTTADLWQANLSDAYVLEADLRGARLAFADLSRVNLAQAASLEGVLLYRTRLDGAILKRELLGPAVGEEQNGRYDQARAVYVALKHLFRTAGQYNDARWAATKERQMEQATHWPPLAQQFYGRQELQTLPPAGLARGLGLGMFYGRHGLAYGLLWLWGLTSGYSQNPLRVVLTALALWLGLAFWYWLGDGLVSGQTRRLRLIDYLSYSFAALTGRDWSDLQPAGPVTRTLTRLAPLISVALIALFVVTLNG